jgi:Domain of unknown function (DUF305)
MYPLLSSRGVVAALSGMLLKHSFGTAVLGARLLIAFALPSHVLAHENHPAAQPAAAVAEAPFYKENEAAMNRMMAAMDVKPSGDIDRDFVAMMTPHHQGAIDMAVIELRYGKNERLRRIAQEIIVEQRQEIDAMKLALGEQVTDTTPAPTQQPGAKPGSAATSHDHMNMHDDMMKQETK